MLIKGGGRGRFGKALHFLTLAGWCNWVVDPNPTCAESLKSKFPAMPEAHGVVIRQKLMPTGEQDQAMLRIPQQTKRYRPEARDLRLDFRSASVWRRRAGGA